MARSPFAVQTYPPAREGRSRALAMLLVFAAGCSNPLASDKGDYPEAISLDRLRRIEPLTLPTRGSVVEEDPAGVAARRFDGLESVELTLEEVRLAALANNLDLRAALIEPALANESLSAEEAAFEALFTPRFNASRTDSPTSSELDDSQAETFSFDPAVTIPLRTGGSASVSLPMSRNETTNEFSTLNPAYTADLRFSVSHPLLRNAGRFATTYAIRVAAYDLQVSEAQAKLSVIGQIAGVERAYWRLYESREDLVVRQRQYELAAAQLERARRRVAAGAVAEIEVIRAESGVADSLEQIIIAQNQVLLRQRELKRRANIPGLGVDSAAMVVPRTTPDPVRYELHRAELLNAALANRMELLQEELRIAQAQAGIRLSENQAMPSLGLTAAYTVNGLGPEGREAFETLAENRFEDWSVGLAGEFPIGNEAALSRLRRAILTRLQRLVTRDGREQLVRQEVLDAAEAIDAGWQRLLAARQAVVMNARALDAEERQFGVGRSTSTDVLDASTRLADAQLSEIRALVDYQVAQTNLAEATGLIMGATRLRWEPAGPPPLGGSALRPAALPADSGRTRP